MANIPLKSIKFPDLADTYTVPSNAGELAYNKSATYPADTVGKALQDKPDADGTIANAEQLTSNIYEEDNIPYNFRTSGGSIDIGDRETDMLVGGSVVWNQLIYGNFSAANQWTALNGYITVADNVLTNTMTATVTSSYNFKIQQSLFNYMNTNDKIFMAGTVSPSITGGLQIALTNATPANNPYYGTTIPANTWKRENIIFKVNEGAHHFAQVYLNTDYANWQVGDSYKVKDFIAINLTRLFGSTIADYIYSLETATAGAGCAFITKMFPKLNYAFDAGSLQSVNTSTHNTVGFNAWDEVTESGYINNSTGENVSSTSQIRGKNYIPVIPNTTYYFKSPTGLFVYFYDANKGYIGVHGSGTRITNNTITLGADVHYIRVSMPSDYGTTYNNDICINISWDGERDGEYEAYVKHSYALDSDLVLRGISKLDNGNLYYDGDTYESDGAVTRKYTSISPTSCVDGYNRPNGDFIGRLAANGRATDNYVPANIVSNLGLPVLGANYHYNDSGSGLAINANNGQVIICIAGITSKADLDTWLATNKPTFVYELATPTTESADPYTNPQIVNDFGTEEYVDGLYSAGTRDVAIPVGHQTQYMANLKAKLEMSPSSPEGAGDYIVRQTNGENEYVTLASNATIQDIIARLEALENAES